MKALFQNYFKIQVIHRIHRIINSYNVFAISKVYVSRWKSDILKHAKQITQIKTYN